MHLTLAFNPSHLEAVNPVVEGSVRARQHRRGDDKGVQVLPVLIHGDAAVAGPGRDPGSAEHGADPRLLHGRHDPHRRQQPDRLHDLRPAGHARHALLHGHREDGRGADLPRQRRRPGSLSARDRDGDGLPAAVPPGRLHRPRLLPPARAQRGRRADDHAAADVQADRPAPGHAPALRGPAGRGRRHHAGGRGRDGRHVPRGDGQGPAHEHDDPVELQAAADRRLVAVHEAEVDRAGRHRRAAGDAADARAEGHRGPGRLQAASARRARACRSPGDGRGHAAARLGDGRDARLRDAAARRLRRAAVRRGRRPRHVLAPPCGAARPEPREVGFGQLDPARAGDRGQSGVRGDRLGADRERGARASSTATRRRTRSAW